MVGTPEPERREFALFLRARRAEISPQQAGVISDGPFRRVTGLRREEVAQRAGISVDYYTRLEQARLPAPSRAVLDALAEALLLDADQHDYLCQLADRAPGRRPRAQLVPAPVRAVMADLKTTPALVLGRFMQILAWNALAAELLTDFSAVPPSQRNYLRMIFLHHQMRERLPDWERSAAECVAVMRMDAGRYPNDPQLAILLNELRDADPDFEQWWTAHHVSHKMFGHKQIHHPDVGTFRVDWQILTVPQDPDQCLLVMPAADHASAAALSALAGQCRPPVPSEETHELL